MSISGALSNALSGLTASARSANVAASNISNAMTDGYGVREVILSPRSIGDEGGVTVVGLRRVVDQVLLADRREAEADLTHADTTSTFFERIQVALGLPSDAGSLSDRVAVLEASLAAATRAPESESHLLSIRDSLASVADHLNDIGNAVQQERARADGQIAEAVEELNTMLGRLEELNARIRRHTVLDHDVSAMLDERQKLVDQVSELVPVTELDRGQGVIALMAAGGTMLLDGRASTVEFHQTGLVTPHLSIEDDTLSALSINGRDVNTFSERSPIRGGKLAALFEIRDEHSVDFQAQIDGFARDLIDRFSDPGVDPTLVSGDPALLTDDGTAFDPLDEVGLAQRISLNALVDPDQGGEIWRIRDGLGAASPGPEGQTSGLLRLSAALAAYQAPASSAFTGGERTASTLAADISSFVGGAIQRADINYAFATAQFETLKELELADGVDTDAEMQRLLLIEQAYSANARVVQVVDEMLDWLMRIGS